jgi:CRP-like cAMP-binding protein
MPISPELYSYVINEERHADKSVIIKEGAHGNWTYLVLEGRVKVKKQTPNGMVTIDKIGEGEMFGEMALLQEGDADRTATVIADGPVLLGMLDTHRIVEELSHLSPQLRKFLYTLSKRLKSSTAKVVSILNG